GDALVQAGELMQRWAGVDPQRIGIISSCVGDLLACVGAADPRIRDRVAFLAFLGGYVNVTSLLSTLGRRAQDVDGQTKPWQPISTDLYVLARTVSSLLSLTDQQLLQQAFPLTTRAL